MIRKSSEKNEINQPRLLVMIGSAGSEPWLTIEKTGQKKTFGSEVPSWANLVWVEGDAKLSRGFGYRILNFIDSLFLASFHRFRLGTLRLFFFNSGWALPGLKLIHSEVARRALTKRATKIGSRVTLAFPNLYYLTGVRTLYSLHWALNNSDFDFVLKTTSTCYIDWSNLEKTLARLPKKRTYAGVVLKLGNCEFMSGAARLFSRDVAASILQNQHSLRWDTFEDVAIGDLIKKKALADFISLKEIDLYHGIDDKMAEADSGVFLYRCKTSKTTTDSSRLPVARMVSLHQRLRDLRQGGSLDAGI